MWAINSLTSKYRTRNDDVYDECDEREREREREEHQCDCSSETSKEKI